MQGARLATGLATVFGLTALLFAAFGVFFNLAFFAVTAVFGAVAYLVWDHGSGRFARRLYRNVERRAAVDGGRGGFGAGPREEWRGPREDQRERARRRARRQAAGGAGQRRQRQRRPPNAGPSGPSVAEAYERLGLDPSADEDDVRAAYRSKVKEVHPDAVDGDEEAFKEVTAAYERLTD